MKQFKEKMKIPPISAFPKGEKKIFIYTDACDKHVGCVLEQEQDDYSLRQMRYWSRTLYDAKRWYDTTHRECLARVGAVLLLRSFIEGGRFTVRTDHQALKGILHREGSSGRLARFRLRPMELEMNIVHGAGIVHLTADALSCLPTMNGSAEHIEDDILIKCLVHNGYEPCLVDPDAESYFHWK